MSFAVMQPYLFPYLGYYQMVYAVDKFVFYDDVTFIKGGYINRNNILMNGKAQRFTIPVPGMSSNKKINELRFDINVIKVLKSIEQSYRKAPYFNAIFPIIESVLSDPNRQVEHICAQSIKQVFAYLGLEKAFYFSSQLEFDREQSATDKLFSIAELMKSDDYINSPGGKALYNKEHFETKGIKLSFIQTEPYSYQQSNFEFTPHLSMIDVLMWNSKQDVLALLELYSLD
ncbi:WbqC family protein [Rheinheimera salexigens]|uniref:WbqC-like protein n=1 Tax=Rheinheimera salexigens TaxID=1628148 RepID=A0A1E7Q4U5_9GAMM|nr:WbqC family protein [Rheinheimera salexigens]OEY69212.1 hypothetical protein BI198_06225 [Rheinheimera salexigens]